MDLLRCKLDWGTADANAGADSTPSPLAKLNSSKVVELMLIFSKSEQK